MVVTESHFIFIYLFILSKHILGHLQKPDLWLLNMDEHENIWETEFVSFRTQKNFLTSKLKKKRWINKMLFKKVTVAYKGWECIEHSSTHGKKVPIRLIFKCKSQSSIIVLLHLLNNTGIKIFKIRTFWMTFMPLTCTQNSFSVNVVMQKIQTM